eukprot:1899855-Pyramimonas_sp.AAC.1
MMATPTTIPVKNTPDTLRGKIWGHVCQARDHCALVFYGGGGGAAALLAARGPTTPDRTQYRTQVASTSGARTSAGRPLCIGF